MATGERATSLADIALVTDSARVISEQDAHQCPVTVNNKNLNNAVKEASGNSIYVQQNQLQEARRTDSQFSIGACSEPCESSQRTGESHTPFGNDPQRTVETASYRNQATSQSSIKTNSYKHYDESQKGIGSQFQENVNSIDCGGSLRQKVLERAIDNDSDTQNISQINGAIISENQKNLQKTVDYVSDIKAVDSFTADADRLKDHDDFQESVNTVDTASKKHEDMSQRSGGNFNGKENDFHANINPMGDRHQDGLEKAGDTVSDGQRRAVQGSFGTAVHRQDDASKTTTDTIPDVRYDTFRGSFNADNHAENEFHRVVDGANNDGLQNTVEICYDRHQSDLHCTCDAVYDRHQNNAQITIDAFNGKRHGQLQTVFNADRKINQNEMKPVRFDGFEDPPLCCGFSAQDGYADDLQTDGMVEESKVNALNYEHNKELHSNLDLAEDKYSSTKRFLNDKGHGLIQRGDNGELQESAHRNDYEKHCDFIKGTFVNRNHDSIRENVSDEIKDPTQSKDNDEHKNSLQAPVSDTHLDSKQRSFDDQHQKMMPQSAYDELHILMQKGDSEQHRNSTQIDVSDERQGSVHEDLSGDSLQRDIRDKHHILMQRGISDQTGKCNDLLQRDIRDKHHISAQRDISDQQQDLTLKDISNDQYQNLLQGGMIDQHHESLQRCISSQNRHLTQRGNSDQHQDSMQRGTDDVHCTSMQRGIRDEHQDSMQRGASDEDQKPRQRALSDERRPLLQTSIGGDGRNAAQRQTNTPVDEHYIWQDGFSIASHGHTNSLNGQMNTSTDRHLDILSKNLTTREPGVMQVNLCDRQDVLQRKFDSITKRHPAISQRTVDTTRITSDKHEDTVQKNTSGRHQDVHRNVGDRKDDVIHGNETQRQESYMSWNDVDRNGQDMYGNVSERFQNVERNVSHRCQEPVHRNQSNGHVKLVPGTVVKGTFSDGYQSGEVETGNDLLQAAAHCTDSGGIQSVPKTKTTEHRTDSNEHQTSAECSFTDIHQNAVRRHVSDCDHLSVHKQVSKGSPETEQANTKARHNDGGRKVGYVVMTRDLNDKHCDVELGNITDRQDEDAHMTASDKHRGVMQRNSIDTQETVAQENLSESRQHVVHTNNADNHDMLRNIAGRDQNVVQGNISEEPHDAGKENVGDRQENIQDNTIDRLQSAVQRNASCSTVRTHRDQDAVYGNFSERQQGVKQRPSHDRRTLQRDLNSRCQNIQHSHFNDTHEDMPRTNSDTHPHVEQRRTIDTHQHSQRHFDDSHQDIQERFSDVRQRIVQTNNTETYGGVHSELVPLSDIDQSIVQRATKPLTRDQELRGALWTKDQADTSGLDQSGLLQKLANDPQFQDIAWQTAPSFLQANSDVTIDAEASLYVMTRDMEEAQEVMEEKGRVVLCGPPGCGKTTLARAMLRRCRKQGFTPYIFTKVEQWHEHVTKGKKCVVLMDGIFGTVRMNQTQHGYWRLILSNVLELTRKGSCRLIITVYPHVLRELQIFDVRTASPFVDGLSVVKLMQDTLDVNVKKSLIDFHLREFDLEAETQSDIVERILQKDASGPVFPWCCHQMCLNWQSSEDPTLIFTTPAEAYVPLLQQMLHDGEYGGLFAAVLALTMKDQRRFLLKPPSVSSDLAHFGFGSFSADQLENCAYFLRGSILSESGNTFFSRVLYDATGLTLGRSSRLFTLLRVCDLPFLVKYVCTREVENVSSVFVGPEEAETDFLAGKIYEEIVRGNLPKVIQHPCLQCPKFLGTLKALCQPEGAFQARLMNSGKPSLRKLLAAVDVESHLPLLYWATLSRSHILAQWCLELLKDKKRFLSCLPHVLLASAVFHQSSDLYQQVSSLIKNMNINLAKIFTFPTNTVVLPMPKPHERIADEISELLQLLSDYECNSQQLCYLNAPFLPIPPRVIRVQMTEEGVRVQVADRQHWYLVLRLLTDREVDQVDEQGHTLFRLAFEAGVMEGIALVLKKQAECRFPYATGFVNFVFEHICSFNMFDSSVPGFFRFFFRAFFRLVSCDLKLRAAAKPFLPQMNNVNDTYRESDDDDEEGGNTCMELDTPKHTI